MTAQRDPDRLIHEFLLDGAEVLHDQVYDAVRADIEHRRQRAVIGPWRMPSMNRLIPIGLGTAAVAAVLVAGTQLRGPTSAPAASAPVPPALVPRTGLIDPGTYRLSDGWFTIRVTLPAGWGHTSTNRIWKGRDAGAVSFAFNLRDIGVWPDACATEAFPPPTGRTAEDLITALRSQRNSDLSEPAEVSIAGLPGVLLDVGIPAGLDVTTCTNEMLRIWADSRARDNFLYFGEPPGSNRIYILEAPLGRRLDNPRRLVLTTGVGPEATAADQAELQAILDSIQLEAVP